MFDTQHPVTNALECSQVIRCTKDTFFQQDVIHIKIKEFFQSQLVLVSSMHQVALAQRLHQFKIRQTGIFTVNAENFIEIPIDPVAFSVVLIDWRQHQLATKHAGNRIGFLHRNDLVAWPTVGWNAEQIPCVIITGTLSTQGRLFGRRQDRCIAVERATFCQLDVATFLIKQEADEHFSVTTGYRTDTMQQ